MRQVVITSRDPDLAERGLSQGFGRHPPRHDDPRFRPRPLLPARRAGGGDGDGERPHRSDDRAAGRSRYGHDHHEHRRSGAQCRITNHRRAVYGYDQRRRGPGREGHAQGREQAGHDDRAVWTKDITAAQDPLLNFFIERYREAYGAELDAFIDAVEKGAPVPVGFEDGRRALLLANAAYNRSPARRRWRSTAPEGGSPAEASAVASRPSSASRVS